MALNDIISTTKTYKVCRGDTFSDIAARCISVNMPGYSGLTLYNAGINKLKSFNPDIDDIDLIYVGQTITLQLSSGETTPKKTETKAQTAKITAFGLQAKHAADASSRTVFATWAWSKSNTKEYKVKWRYSTGDGVAFIGTESTVTAKQSVYSAPAEATHVIFQVKPISKTYKSGDKEVSYWTAGWSTAEKYYFNNNPPTTPPNPTDSDIKLKDYKLTVTLNNLSEDLNAKAIQIQVWENDKVFRTSSAIAIKSGKVSYSCTCKPGKSYKVRYRSVNGSMYSDWTENFSNEFSTIPAGTDGIYSIYMVSSTSVSLSWYDDSTADSYEVQYTTQKELFDSGTNNGVDSIVLSGDDSTKAKNSTIISGLTAGLEYFFRVRSINSRGKALVWSEIVSIGVGEKPGVPTTWSSRSSVAVGDSLTLYWMHNISGGSRQTGANLEITEGNNAPVVHRLRFGTSNSTNADSTKIVNISDLESLNNNTTIKVYMIYSNVSENISLNVNSLGIIPVKVSESNTYYWDANSLVAFSYNSEEGVWYLTECLPEGSATSYSINTSEYPEGTTIKWRVQTAGIIENENGYIYSEYSTERTVEIHAQPTVVLSLSNSSGESFEELYSLPFNISATALPAVQKPLSYVVSIITNESYETVDSVGNTEMVKAGEEVYYKYFDTSSSSLSVDISAKDINLMNNISYTVQVTVAMNSGLTGEATSDPFTVSWEEDELWPDAEITYDNTTYTTLIKPQCIDSLTDEIVEDVTLSLYRREFDGSYTELATDLDNTEGTYVTDPHPSLDYARYRVVAVKNSTGRVSYYDIPGYPINEKAIIIQWDEEWMNFDTLPVDDENNSYSLETPPWSGSLLRLPYNIDISDKHDTEANLIKYIGREFPVSYYGTQKDHTSTWSFEIEKSDSETLYGLRRLASWLGDVYIREPSGSGYWAKVNVSIDIQHKKLTIPVTIDVTRVEGGK